jgi:predicted neutral ceramidase superfamily lipid hydrolase
MIGTIGYLIPAKIHFLNDFQFFFTHRISNIPALFKSTRSPGSSRSFPGNSSSANVSTIWKSLPQTHLRLKMVSPTVLILFFQLVSAMTAFMWAGRVPCSIFSIAISVVYTLSPAGFAIFA